MAFLAHPALRCPLDGLPLTQNQSSLVCAEGHGFDIGKPGYANLLGAQDKRSRAPGDSRDMVAARSAFLGARFYEPIADALMTQVTTRLDTGMTVVDAGCGEGYYLDWIQNAAPVPVNTIGFDISKWAVQRAAKRCDGTWLVASNRRVPLADSSADVLLDMFGFPDYGSFLRILVPGGALIRITPAANHLIELRKIIYPALKEQPERASYPALLGIESRNRLTYQVDLHSDDIANLLLMTPHMSRAPKDGLIKATSLAELSVTIDVAIDVLTLTT